MPLLVQAETKNNVQITIGRYSSLKESSDEITVEIYSISGGKFSGHLKVKDSDGAVDFDNDVSGTSTYYKDHYVCYCEFKTTWVFGIKYNSNATITVYPYSGNHILLLAAKAGLQQWENMNYPEQKMNIMNQNFLLVKAICKCVWHYLMQCMLLIKSL